jgi:hypothetical protein
MAWICPRCEKRIFAPREAAIRFVFRWKYTKTTEELVVDLKNLKDIRDDAVVTHLHCPETEKPGFKERIKAMLKMPEHREHPLLF